MNKELEALEALESIRGCLQTPYLEDIKNILAPYLDIVETALRRKYLDRNSFDVMEKLRYDEIESICKYYNLSCDLLTMRDAISTLAQLKEEYGDDWYNYTKKLRAYEIIIEKKVYPSFLLNTKSFGEYNKEVIQKLTQEEYDLLKEALKDE